MRLLLVFTAHARRRMSERSIEEEDVLRALERPRRTEPGRLGAWKARADFGERELVVVYRTLGGGLRKVITAYWTLP